MGLCRLLRRAGAKAFWPAGVVLSIATVLPAQTVVNYYSVPTVAASPAEITAGPDGALWFTEGAGRKIGRITTAGVITEYPLPGYTLPWGITAGPDGALWYAAGGNIGRITTAGVITQYTLSSPATGGIAVGPDGALWFSEGPKIGRITVGGAITEYALPGDFPGTWGITAGPDGAMWFTGGIYFGVDAKIGRITTAGVVTVYPLSTCDPVGITAGPDGALWFTTDGDYSCPVVRFSTDGEISKFGSGAGFKITPGPDGALWFTGYSYKIGRLTIDGAFEVVVERDNPDRAYWGTGIAVGPDGNLWFTEPETNRIGQILLPDTTPPAVTLFASPTILWPPNGKMLPVIVSGTIKDIGSGVIASSVEYAVTDEYGMVLPRGHMTLDSSGNYSFTVLLRASREGNDKDGRHYYIRVSARDNAGNRGAKWSVVEVPHDRRY